MKLTVDFEVDAGHSDYRMLPADSEELANQGRRVMVRRDLHSGEFEMFIAPAGELNAGFVVGVEVKSVMGSETRQPMPLPAGFN